MKILVIWDSEEETNTKHIETIKELRKARVNGRKPNRMIIHERDANKVSKRELIKNITYQGVIMMIGSTPKCIYDGRKKTA